jgi:hypothetical protein
MHTNQFADHFNLSEAFLPVNVATAANDGDWVSLKNYSECTILYYQGVGSAAEPATITLEQATAVAGTSAKALAAITTVYQKQAATNLQSTGTWTKVTQAAAATYALGVGANGDKAAIVLITIHAEDLDGDNGFDCLRARVADVGTGPSIGACLYILAGPRYTSLASAIVD